MVQLSIFASRLLACLVLLGMLLAPTAGPAAAQSNPESPTLQTPRAYVPLLFKAGPGLVPLTPQCADCPKNIAGMTGHSLRLDAGSHPHLAYGSDHLYHTWNDGTGWKSEVVDPAPGVGYAASLAFDNNGKVGISYYDDFNHSLKLARWSGTAWTLQTVDSSPYAGYTSSLAFNSAGSPRIAYVDYDTNLNVYHIKYAEWTGAAWHIFPKIDDAGEASLSLALDNSGQAHISYWRNNYPQTGGLVYASWGGSAWTLQIIETEQDAGRNNALAFDSQNKPHISYLDEWNGVVRYASWSGTAWSTEDVFGSGALGMDKNNPTSLAFGSGDMPMIAISLGEGDPTQNLAWLIYKSGGVWRHDQNTDILGGYPGGSGGRWPSIAADSNGKPHISYFDYNTGQLHYASLTAWGPDAWSNTVIDAGAQVGQGVSLAMDRFGRPHAAYMNLTQAVLMYATQVNGAWQTSAVNVPGINPAHGHSLAVDQLGVPHIAYSDRTANKLMYATLNTSGWTAEAVADDTSGTFFPEKYISLALDAAGSPHIAFYNHTDNDLKHYYKVGAAWQAQEIDKGAGVTGEYNAIAIDSAGKIHVSYQDNHTEKLMYAYWNGSTWSKSVVNDTYGSGMNTAITVDSANHPHICHSDSVNYLLLYDHYNGSSWVHETLTPSSAGLSDSRQPVCSIKLGLGDVPYISYFDRPSRHLGLKHKSGTSWVTETLDSNGDTGEHNSLAMFNGTPYAAYYSGSNKDLMFITWKP